MSSGFSGAYSRWALIRGWALIRINTVFRAWATCGKGNIERSEMRQVVAYKRFYGK